MRLKNVFATRWGIISTGLFIGVFAALLQKWGNPGNMGICVACFERDIAGKKSFADVTFRVSPLERGAGIVYENIIIIFESFFHIR